MYLFLTPFFPNQKSFRGSYLLDQSIEINKQIDDDVLVIILGSFFSKNKSYEINGIKCEIFRIIDFPSFFFPGFFNFLNQLRFNQFLAKKKIVITSESVVHGHINYPSLHFLKNIKKKYNCKTILQHHALDVLQFKTGRIKLLKTIQNRWIKYRFLKDYSFADLHLGVSQKVLDNLINIVPQIKQRSSVLYNGVDTSKFYSLNNTLLSFKIGCVANFWPLKDQMTLIKSIELINNKYSNYDIECIFVGEGPTLKMCKEYIAKKNIVNIKFIDSINHDKLNDFYNDLSLFVLPSFYEALGCVFLESWATGTPFIAVENQGIEELICADNKEMQLITKGDYKELSKKILHFYHNKKRVVFNQNYNIKNTIGKFLKQTIHLND